MVRPARFALALLLSLSAACAATADDDAESAAEHPPEHPPERPVARATRQLAALGEHLGRCGFAGAIDPGAHELTLRDCPFSALSEGNPQVCEVHRTLIADALRASSGPVRAGRLRRLVTERECTLELTREQPTTTSSGDLP